MPTTCEAVRFEHVTKVFNLRESDSLKEFLSRFVFRTETTSRFKALSDVSFSLSYGETLGLVGRNGSGKSTLVKLIAGVTSPTSGTVETKGRVVPLIELGAGFHPDFTGRENVFLNGTILGMDDEYLRANLDAIFEYAELQRFADVPVKRYSSGMYLRLAFAVAAHCQPEILLIDEALTVGDIAFQKKCLDRIRQFQQEGVAIVLVSHTLSMLQEVCDRLLLLERGEKIAEGDPTEVGEAYFRLMGETATINA